MTYAGALFTDVDGTLFRGSLEIALAKNLISKGLVKQEHVAEVLRLERERRHRRIPFRVVERAWVDVLDSALGFEGVDPKDVLDAARELVEEDGQMVYVFTRELIASCKEQGYLTVAVSYSSEDIVKPFCEQFGFDVVIGALYPNRYGGHAADKPQQIEFHDKGETMDRVLAEHGREYANVIAVGDSAADYPMLHKAFWPIAFNPNGELIDFLSEPGRIQMMRPYVIVRDSKDAITADAIVFDDPGVYQTRSCALRDCLPRPIAEDMRQRLGNAFKFPDARFYMKFQDEED